MARKKVREVTSKALLKAHIKRLAGLDLPLNAVQVRRASQRQAADVETHALSLVRRIRIRRFRAVQQQGAMPCSCCGACLQQWAWHAAVVVASHGQSCKQKMQPRRRMASDRAAVAQVTQATDYAELLSANPWLKTTRLVVKPDMLFGKRGKHDLVGLDLDFAGVEQFIKARMNKQARSGVGIGTATSRSSTFGGAPAARHSVAHCIWAECQQKR